MKTCLNKHENPDEAKFCRYCGLPFEEVTSGEDEGNEESNSDLPFYLQHPELHLRPISEFPMLRFLVCKPEYLENPADSIDRDYLFMVRKRRLGILYWHFEKHWLLNTNKYHRVIPCRYDHIEKKDDMFVCWKGTERVFIDKKGNILK